MRARDRIVFLSVVTAAALAALVAVGLRPTPQQAPSLRAALDRATEAKAAVDRVGQRVAQVSDAEEKVLGWQILSDMAGSDWLLSQEAYPEARAWLGDIIRKLEAEGGLRRGGAIPYTVDLIGSPHPNAFALPGGHLVVTTGMLSFLRSEAEAAALLGHEMAHVDLRHCIERHQYAMQARKVAGGAGELLGHVAARVLLQGYQDDQELEADRWGMTLAARAGYHPQGGALLFARLRQMPSPAPRTVPGEVANAARDALEATLASHPNMDLRIQALERAMDELGLDPAGRDYTVGVRNCQEQTSVLRHAFPGERQRVRFPIT